MTSMFQGGYDDYMTDIPEYQGNQDNPLGFWDTVEASRASFFATDTSMSKIAPINAYIDVRNEKLSEVVKSDVSLYNTLMHDDEKRAEFSAMRKGGIEPKSWLDSKMWTLYNEVQDELEANPSQYMTDDEIFETVRGNIASDKFMAEFKLSRSDEDFAKFIGTGWGAMQDPINILSIPFGGEILAARALGTWGKIGAYATGEGIVGAVSETLIQPAVIETHEFIGADYDIWDAASNIAVTGTASFALGFMTAGGFATAGKAYDYLKAHKKKVDDGVDNNTTPLTDDEQASLRNGNAFTDEMGKIDPNATPDEVEAHFEGVKIKVDQVNTVDKVSDTAWPEADIQYKDALELELAMAKTPEEIAIIEAKINQANQGMLPEKEFQAYQDQLNGEPTVLDASATDVLAKAESITDPTIKPLEAAPKTIESELDDAMYKEMFHHSDAEADLQRRNSNDALLADTDFEIVIGKGVDDEGKIYSQTMLASEFRAAAAATYKGLSSVKKCVIGGGE
jgi:hypothetical protein